MHSEEFTHLPLAQQAAAFSWCDAIDQMPGWEVRSTEQAIQRLAETMHTTPKTARRMYDWSRNGKVLADGRRIHGWRVFCDLRKCTVAGVKGVPEATALWFRQGLDEFKGRKNCRKQAYNRVIAAWKMGMPIPGYATPPPSGPNGVPDGWSYGNFCVLVRQPKYTQALAHTGAKAAARYAFQVPMTRVGLEVGQYYMVDDSWGDFNVKCTLKSVPMRLLELCALDLYSGSKFCYGLKPEQMNDETGVRQRLQKRDMRFLAAAMFSLHGYRRVGGTTMICESGTANPGEDLAKVLFDNTSGAIRVEIGGVRGTPAFPGYYAGRRGGNPRFKAALESHFNLDRNATALLIGQVGSNERVNAPEELHGRKDADEALLTALRKFELPPEKIEMIRWNFMLMSQAQSLLGNIYAYLEGRTDHDLEGYEEAGLVTGEVRVDPRSPLWTPTYALPASTPDQYAALQALMRIDGCFRLRKMSPQEVFARGSSGLSKIPMSLLPAIIGVDLAEERKLNDHGGFLFEDTSIAPAPIRFLGLATDVNERQVLLRDGETYLTFLNPFDPRYLLVCDSRARYIGRCLRVNKVSRANAEELHEAMGQAAHHNAAVAREFLGRNAERADNLQADQEHNAALLAGAPVTPDEKSEQRARDRVIRKLDPETLLDEGERGDAVEPVEVAAGADDFDPTNLL
jgi:hypothetical protein